MKILNFFSARYYFIFSIFAILFSYNVSAQIRLVAVDPGNDKVTIQNFGTTTVPISDYWFCTLLVYDQLNSFTIDSGSLNLTAGSSVTLSGLNLRDSDADLGLYTSRSFGSATAMEDFMQWGDAGNGRESVANTANLWSSGDFLTGAGPFIYNGNGNQNGLSFWSTGTLSINDEVFSSMVSIYPNPVNEILNIKSLESVKVKNIAIFDATGRMIQAHNKLTENINLKSIQRGFYTLRLTDAQGRTVTRKIIKE